MASLDPVAGLTTGGFQEGLRYALSVLIRGPVVGLFRDFDSVEEDLCRVVDKGQPEEDRSRHSCVSAGGTDARPRPPATAKPEARAVERSRSLSARTMALLHFLKRYLGVRER